MKKTLLVLFAICHFLFLFAQDDKTQDVSPDPTGVKAVSGDLFIGGKKNFSTGIKDQERTNTCWSFATTSLVESQVFKNRLGAYDLSEMFTVRNIYIEKARNYILRQGHAQFSEGGLGHDVIRAYTTYGAVPQNVYPGLLKGEMVYDHQLFFKELKKRYEKKENT